MQNLRRRTKMLLLLLLLTSTSSNSELSWIRDNQGRPCRWPSCSASCSCRPYRPAWSPNQQQEEEDPCLAHALRQQQRGCAPHNGGPWRPRPLECPPAPALHSGGGQGKLSSWWGSGTAGRRGRTTASTWWWWAGVQWSGSELWLILMKPKAWSFYTRRMGHPPPPTPPSDRFDRLRVNPSMQGLLTSGQGSEVGVWKGKGGRSLWDKKRGGALLEAG